MRASSCSQAPGVASAPPPARLLPRLPISWHLPVVPVAEQNATALKGFSACDVRHVRNAASPTSSEASPVFRHSGELDLSLREYMVVLEKPVGLTLAPDPRTGQVVVQDIKVGSPAHKCGLIQVGDVVQSVSAVFGDDMWAAADIRRVRWAINSRMGDVRLILERCRRLGHGGATTSWYSSGKTGVATRELAGMQLPFAFTSPSPDILGSSTALLSGSSSGLTRSGGSSMIPAPTPTGSSNGLGAIPGPSSTTSAAGFATAAAGLGAAAAAAAGRGGGATPYNSLASVSGVGVGVGLADGSLLVELPGAGRSMTVSFHRNTVTQPPPSRRAAAAVAARAAALARLRRELQQARHMPRLDLSGQGQPRAVTAEAFMGSLPSSSSSSPSPSSSGAATRGATSPGAKSPSPSGSSTPGGSSSSGGGSSSSGGGSSSSGGGSSSSSNSTSSSMKSSEAAAGMAPPPPPVVDVVAPAPSKEDDGDGPAGGGSGSSSGGGGGGILGLRFGGAGGGGGAPAAAAAAPPARSAGPKERRVVSVLPWLLVALGRLEHRHIAHIASSRSLGALLELSLTRSSSSSSGGSGGSSGGSDAAAGAAGVASTSGSSSSTTTTGSSSSTTTTGSSSTTGTSTSSSSSSTTTGSSSSSGGGYLVVRGSDLAPLGADMGRASYASLLAAAEAAGNSCAPSSSAAARGGGAAPATGGAAGPVPTAPIGPAGEAPPPPPPGSAAATAVLIDGPDALKASAGAVAGGSSSAAAAANPSLVDAALAAGSSASSSGGSTTSNTGGGGGGLGSSTMAFLGRSIFINLRPSFGGANPANPSNPSANANSPLPSSSSSASSSSSSSLASSGSRGGLPRYDAARVAHLLNAAASLQRLAFRRGGRLHRARRDACAVLLHCCDEGMESDVAVLLAGWLHWYGRLPLQEAALAAETALGGAPVDTALLEAGTAALLAGGRERCSRVVLTWKYGGLSAYVAGDVVASWAARVPMVRCRSPLGCKGDTHPGHFFLEVTGLPPGAYFYKYIVDGTWAVDSLSNKVLDSAGNWNNVLVVPEPPQVLTSREGLALARWQAARMALEAKMGLSGPGAFMQRGPH